MPSRWRESHSRRVEPALPLRLHAAKKSRIGPKEKKKSVGYVVLFVCVCAEVRRGTQRLRKYIRYI